MTLEDFPFDPSAQLDYSVDWADWLSVGDTINSSAWTVPSGMTSVSEETRQHTGTAQAGAAKTITLAAGASAADQYYTNLTVRIIGGTGLGQSRKVLYYVGSTKVATVDKQWATTPDSTSVYLISAAVIFLRISGATVGQRKEVINQVTTASSPNRIEQRTIVFRIVEK